MRCLDEDCEGQVEPEGEGAVQFFECGTCGSRWGYQQVAEDACASGALRMEPAG